MGNHLFGQAVSFDEVGDLPMLGAGRAGAALIVLAPSIMALTGSTGTFGVVSQNTSGPSAASGSAFQRPTHGSHLPGNRFDGIHIHLCRRLIARTEHPEPQCTRISATRGWTTVPSGPIRRAFELSENS